MKDDGHYLDHQRRQAVDAEALRPAAHDRNRAGTYEPDEARHAMLDRVASEQSAVGDSAPNRPKG